MRRKPTRITSDDKITGPVDMTQKLSGQFSGNDATMTQSAGSRESLAMEQVPAKAHIERQKKDRRNKRLRSENKVPTSATPGAYSQASAYVPSGARY